MSRKIRKDNLLAKFNRNEVERADDRQTAAAFRSYVDGITFPGAV